MPGVLITGGRRAPTAKSGGAAWSPYREEWWDNLALRVRVGWFERVETVDFGSRTAFVLKGA